MEENMARPESRVVSKRNYRLSHIKKGLCTDCSKKAVVGKKKCQYHMDKRNKYNRERRDKLKEEMDDEI